MNPYDPDGRPAWRPRRPKGHVDPDAELTLDDVEKHAVNGVLAVTVLGGGGRLFKRRALEGIGAAQPRSLTWIVAELEGVRCYAVPMGARTHVVVTTDDLYP